MSAFSDQLKQQADIVKIIGESVKLRQAGANWIGLCPFHQEKTPSFHVHAARRFYYCFGCQAKGDVYRFLMERRKIGFSEAVAAVAERCGVAVPAGAGLEGQDAGYREALRVHELADGFYQRCLRQPEAAAARAHLSGRGVAEPLWERFGLGYAPESGRALVQHLRGQKINPEVALRAGLVQPRRASSEAALPDSLNDWDQAYDRFRNRLLFAIQNEAGKTIAFGGRRLDEAAGPKYLNSPDSPIYAKHRVLYNLNRARDAIRRYDYTILVEGYFDCLAVFMAGFENVVASCGTALSAGQVQLLARHSRNVVVSYDPDGAGAAAAERSIGLLLEENLRIRVLQLPAGLDPDLFLRRQGRDAYARALEASLPYFDYLLARARQRYQLASPEGKSAALKMLLPYCTRIHDPILRAATADKLAGALQVDSAVLRRSFLQAVRERRAEWRDAPAAEPLPAERVLLRAWAEEPEGRPRLAAILEQENLLEGLASASLFAELLRAPAPALDNWLEISEHCNDADRRLWLDTQFMSGLIADPLEVTKAIEALRLRRREILASQQTGKSLEEMQAAYLERKKLAQEAFHLDLGKRETH